MLEKATKSSTRDYLGFSASDVADGISKLAVNESNSKQVRLLCFGCMIKKKESKLAKINGKMHFTLLSGWFGDLYGRLGESVSIWETLDWNYCKAIVS